MKLTQAKFSEITNEVITEALSEAQTQGLAITACLALSMTYAAAFDELADKLFNNETVIEFKED